MLSDSTQILTVPVNSMLKMQTPINVYTLGKNNPLSTP